MQARIFSIGFLHLKYRSLLYRAIQDIFVADLYACNRNSSNCLYGSSEKPRNDNEGCRLSRQADMERSNGSGYRSRYRIVHCLSVDRNGIAIRRCTNVLDNRTNRTCKPEYSAGYVTRHTRHGHSRSIDRRHDIQGLCIAFAQRMHRWVAITVSSLIFALLHIQFFGPGMAIWILFFGTASAWLYSRFDNIYPSLLFHALNNLWAYIILPMIFK